MKTISQSVHWVAIRILRHFIKPRYSFIKLLMNAIHAIKKQFFRLITRQESNNYLIAIYDLSSSSVTFDFSFFLASAESFALKHKKDKFLVYIVKGENPELKGSLYNSIVDDEALRWRLENIIIPLIGLYPKCIGYSVLPDQESIYELISGKFIYPSLYGKTYTPIMEYKEIFSLLNKNNFLGFRASAQGIKYLKSWVKESNIKSPMVVITIRQYGFDDLRNSNIDEWIKFATWVSKKGFTPVFIPDTNSCYKQDTGMEKFTIFREACWNLGLRMAIYEEAYLNFVMAGPSSIAQLNRRVRCVTIYTVLEDSQESTRRSFERDGMMMGVKSFDFATKFQVLFWGRDNFENIRLEFNNFTTLDMSTKLHLKDVKKK